LKQKAICSNQSKVSNAQKRNAQKHSIWMLIKVN